MDNLIEFYNWVQIQLTQNSFLIGILGGGIGYGLLRIWSIFVSVLKNLFVANVEVNTSTGSAIDAVESYFNSKEFLNASFIHKKLSLLGISKKDDNPIFSPGYDRHYFFYNHWVYWVDKNKDEKVNNKIAYNYIISTIGISSKKILHFINDISEKVKENKSDSLSIYSVGIEYTTKYDVDKRTINSIFFDKKNKKKLLERLDFFVNNEKWYADRGIPYKLGILFHGMPGTGKSSLIKAIATYLDSSIIYVNAESDKSSLLETIRDGYGNNENIGLFNNNDGERFNPLIENGKKKIPIVVIEEVDTCLDSRNDTLSEHNGRRHTTMNLKDYLNIIDGVLCPPGTIFILTTNHKEKLDPALVRAGRVDLDIEMGPIDKELILDMVNTYEPNIKIELPDNIMIVPSKLQEILLTNAGNGSIIKSEILNQQYKE